jgi:hypothetical protein
MKQVSNHQSNDRGSISPLLIGLAAISLAVLLTVSSAISIYIQKRRLITQAEAVAIAEISESPLAAELSESPMRRITYPDGKTIEVQICEAWKTPIPIGGWLSTAIKPQIVCGSAKSREVN